MELNALRDEVRGFIDEMSLKQNNLSQSQILDMIDEEVILLKESCDNRERLTHKIYDLLFLLLEIAAMNGLDMDSEWIKGREKKRVKYLGEQSGFF